MFPVKLYHILNGYAYIKSDKYPRRNLLFYSLYSSSC